MDELLAVLENILSELEEMNSKLEEIKGIMQIPAHLTTHSAKS